MLNPLLSLLALACTPSDPPQDQEAAGGAAALLFENVAVVPMDAPRVLEGRDLLVRAGRIEALGPTGTVELPEGVRRVARGGFLMPSLVDAHVHIFEAAELPLYVANGITTVRNMWGWDLHLELRSQGLDGDPWIPTIVTSGPPLDGPEPRLRGMLGLSTADQAREAVVAQVEQGFDFIKVYDGLPAPAYGAALLTARRLGVPVAGHVPQGVGLELALASGQGTIEHLQGYLSPPDGLLPELAAATARAGTWSVPTLCVLEALELSSEESRRYLARPEIDLLPRTIRRYCCDTPKHPADDLSPEERTERREARFAAVRELRAAGARILVGTDSGNRFVAPGFSIHDEIGLLVAAGLSPYEVLRAATLDPAVFFGSADDRGTVEVGKSADLLLLEGNPLENPETLRQPLGLVHRGHWMSREDLRRKLEDNASR